MSDTTQYIPTTEFLRLLNGKLSHNRLLEMLAAGELDAVQPGGRRGRYFVRRSEADRLLAPVGDKK